MSAVGVGPVAVPAPVRSSQPVSADGGDDLVTVEQIEKEGLVGGAAVDDDGGLPQRGAQPRQRFVSVAAPRDDLGDHRVVVGRDDVALRDAGVDPDAGAQRELQQPHGARRGRKVVVGILGVQPGLDGVAELGRAFALESTAAGDDDLQLHQVEAGGDLGDRVLDLQPGVDLEEREDLLLRLVEELHRAGAAVAGRADQFGRHASQVVGLLLGEYRRAGFLDQLLVPALDGAVAHSRRPDVAVVVGDDLDLDMAGIGDQALHEDDRVAERALGLALRALECDFELVGANTLRMPRPPPPLRALMIIG